MRLAMCDCTPPDVHMVRLSLGPHDRSWSGFFMKLDLVVVNIDLCAGAEVATGTAIRMLGVMTQQGQGDSQGPRQVAMTAALADGAAVPGAAAVAIMQALVSLHNIHCQDPLAESWTFAAFMVPTIAAAQAKAGWPVSCVEWVLFVCAGGLYDRFGGDNGYEAAPYAGGDVEYQSPYAHQDRF